MFASLQQIRSMYWMDDGLYTEEQKLCCKHSRNTTTHYTTTQTFALRPMQTNRIAVFIIALNLNGEKISLLLENMWYAAYIAVFAISVSSLLSTKNVDNEDA